MSDEINNEDVEEAKEALQEAEEAIDKAEGLGDTVDNIASATGIKSLVKYVEDMTGSDCGCEKRKEILNELVSYGNKMTEKFNDVEKNKEMNEKIDEEIQNN